MRRELTRVQELMAALDAKVNELSTKLDNLEAEVQDDVIALYRHHGIPA